MSEYNKYGVLSPDTAKDLSQDLNKIELRVIKFLENNADKYSRGLLTQTIFDSIMNRTSEFYLTRASRMRKQERQLETEIIKSQEQLRTLRSEYTCR